jgi:ATP adenylyltransferase/5',5'''-P-1,P-4-tetraphosphate phosphorylase II
MQLIPFESMHTRNLPVEQVALKQYANERSRFFRLDQFKKFQHVVGMLDFGQETFEKLASEEATYSQAAEVLVKTYWNCLNYLGVTELNHNGNEEEDTKNQSYNVWLTPRMMFIVLREKNSVEGSPESQEDLLRPTVDINTLGFAGTIAVKNEASFRLLRA